MRRFKRIFLCTGALACGMTSLSLGPSVRADVSADLDGLKAEVAQLRAANLEMKSQVAAMQGQQSENWLNERRAEEVKALVRDVLADADTRASLAGGGPIAGHDGKNFYLADEAGKFMLQIGGRIQVRYIANFREIDSPAPTNGDENETGFQIRRMKPFFKGYIGSPKFGYNFVLAADRNSTTFALEEAVVDYKLTDGLTVYGGRTKAPFLREELISSGRQLAVERSAVNEIFTTGFVEGVGLRYEQNMFRVAVMVNDGQNSGEIGQGNAPYFPDSVPNGGGRDFNNDQTDIAVTGRAEVRVLGDWKQADEFASWGNEEASMIVGVAGHYELGETGNQTTAGDNDSFIMWTADASFKQAGLTLYGAVIGRHDNDEDDIDGENNRDAYGALAQLGYMVIPDKLEPFVRWEYYNLDNITQADENQLLTAGFNYYFNKHNAKFTMDVVWAYKDAMFTNFTGLGLLADQVVGGSQDQNNQVALRAQFQLQF